MIIVGRPPLSVGTYGSISIAPYGTGYRARTLYRDYDGATRRVERHGQTKGAAERALRLALRDRVHVGAEAEITPDTKIAGLAETWFAEISAQDRSPGTLRAYRDRIDRQIIPALGNLRVRELTTGLVDPTCGRSGTGTARRWRSCAEQCCREWPGWPPAMTHLSTTP